MAAFPVVFTKICLLTNNLILLPRSAAPELSLQPSPTTLRHLDPCSFVLVFVCACVYCRLWFPTSLRLPHLSIRWVARSRPCKTRKRNLGNSETSSATHNSRYIRTSVHMCVFREGVSRSVLATMFRIGALSGWCYRGLVARVFKDVVSWEVVVKGRISGGREGVRPATWVLYSKLHGGGGHSRLLVVAASRGGVVGGGPGEAGGQRDVSSMAPAPLSPVLPRTPVLYV